ncbi:conserved hypothetical protein [Verticillium alfalfae VaMs.102]|uniref:Uncharacterized protein n=1 Tax=Verticillium alfalfae (strain VaMs.102 / ATCC MYA-4576 / FGSC 10136) TaxID=526221 RepID=C9SAJ9_VERA1|nr:conserved hypothetical protein [Verticillium alfalfae VaMs.102]EEY15447.1 conserved hypothetical protein [Verticillium alfalfae VaMs.102]
MAPSYRNVVLVALAAIASADSEPTVWGSVAVIMNGERTPLRGGLASTITPQGAQQMYGQGVAFRHRYIDGTNAQDSIFRAPIRGIERDTLDNSQLTILTNTDVHTIAGATAFLQGLYPPVDDEFLDEAGGVSLSYDAVTDNYTQYPLSGYQYPAINTLSTLEETSIPLHGHKGCFNWLNAMDKLPEDENIRKEADATLESYREIFSSLPLDGAFADDFPSFWNAYDVFDYVRYQANHNSTIHRQLEEPVLSEPTLAFLERNAFKQQLALNTDSSLSGASTRDPVRSIAGQALAQGILDALAAVVSSRGETDKLTLMFTSFHPFIAFWSLTQLLTTSTDPSSPYASFPAPGFSMSFELISDQPGQPGQFPSNDDLRVRFVIRNTNSSTTFRADNIFGTPVSEYIMTLDFFATQMRNIAIDVGEWAPFRGAEKRAEDADVVVSRGGARHERVGSWELRDGRPVTADEAHFRDSKFSGAGLVFDKETGQTSERETADDDGVSVLSTDITAQPVRPRESV